MALEDRLHGALSRYMQAPAPVRNALGRAYAAIPDRVRYGPRYAGFVERTQDEAGCRWSHVEALLEATLAAAMQVPHFERWRHVLLGPEPAWDRLARLPVTSKADIKRSLPRHVSELALHRDLLPMFTGGSTEQPMQFYLHKGVSRPKETAYVKHVESSLMGVAPGAWSLSLRGRTVRSAAREGGRLWATEPIKRHLIFSSDHLEARFMPAYVEALQTLRPTVIHAFASALFPLAQWLRAYPCPAFEGSVQAILLTSETVYGFQSELFRQVFPQARIVRHYGHSERVLMATAEGDGPYRFNPLYGYPELIDARGEVIREPGVVGELVGTSFDNAVMPFVRYRTGDLGVWHEVPEPGHGRPLFQMTRIDGRLQEFVVCRDRRLVSITTLGAAHFSELASVDAIQFEQHRPGHVVLHAATSAGLSADDRRRIEKAVHDKTQGGCEVEVNVVASIERTARGKHRMLVQHLPLTSHLGAGGPVPAVGLPAHADAQVVP